MISIGKQICNLMQAEQGSRHQYHTEDKVHDKHTPESLQRPLFLSCTKILADDRRSTLLKSILWICRNASNIVRYSKCPDCECTIDGTHGIDYNFSQWKCHFFNDHRNRKFYHRRDYQFSEWNCLPGKAENIFFCIHIKHCDTEQRQLWNNRRNRNIINPTF